MNIFYNININFNFIYPLELNRQMFPILFLHQKILLHYQSYYHFINFIWYYTL
jgi:hypothetical protein